MEATSFVAGAKASFAALKNLSLLLINERDRQKAAAIQIEFSEKLIEAQTQLFELLGTVIQQQGNLSVLEQRIRELDARAAEKQRYELAKVGSGREFFAYRLRPPSELQERADEAPHFICQPCFEAGKKAVLIGNGEGFWECPVCKVGVQTEPVQQVFVGRRDSRGY